MGLERQEEGSHGAAGDSGAMVVGACVSVSATGRLREIFCENWWLLSPRGWLIKKAAAVERGRQRKRR